MMKTTESGSQVQVSDLVIPAVPGEFYSYFAGFTRERSVYALLKCKSNKARPLESAGELGHEANLVFIFGDENRVQVAAVQMATAFGLLGDVAQGTFGETWIAPAGISADEFRALHSRKDMGDLLKISQVAREKPETSIELRPGMVIAMATGAGKHGLFLVKEVGQGSVQIEACHILL
jgi:hypothetical protein